MMKVHIVGGSNWDFAGFVVNKSAEMNEEAALWLDSFRQLWSKPTIWLRILLLV